MKEGSRAEETRAEQPLAVPGSLRPPPPTALPSEMGRKCADTVRYQPGLREILPED